MASEPDEKGKEKTSSQASATALRASIIITVVLKDEEIKKNECCGAHYLGIECHNTGTKEEKKK